MLKARKCLTGMFAALAALGLVWGMHSLSPLSQYALAEQDDATFLAALSTGSITLTDDITLSQTAQIDGNVTIDLNGHVINYAGENGAVLSVLTGGTLTIQDSNSQEISHSYAVAPNGRYELSEGEPQKLFGGVITGGKAGGITIESGASLVLCGGNIVGNQSDEVTFGGIYVGGDLTVSGNPVVQGNIAGNAICNAFLPVGKTITAGELKDGAVIGITPQDNYSGAFVTEYYPTNQANPSVFFADDKLSKENMTHMAILTDEGTVGWKEVRQVALPAIQMQYVFGSFDYAAMRAGVTDYTITGTESIHDVNSYPVVFTLDESDGVDKMWSDRSEEPLVINVEVTPLLIAKPTEGEKTFVYNGEEQTYTAIAGDDNTAYYSSLSYTAKNADSYTFQVTLNQPTNTRWADGSIEDISFTFTIEKLSIAIPAEDTSSFYYTGEAQTYHIEENKYYQVTNNVQTEAGQYTVVVSLIDDNVQWADGTRNNITYTFLLSAVKELSLMWLIGVLTFILLLELLVGNVYWLETKKKQDKELQRRGITTNALGGITPLLLTVYYIPTWQVVLVVVLVVAIMAVAIYNVFRALRESEEVKEDDNFILSHVVSHMQAHTYAQRYVTYMPVISDENIDKEGKVPKQLPEEAVDEQPLLEEGNAKLTEGKQETLTDQMVDDYIDDYLKNHQDDYFPPAEAQPLSEDRAQEGQAQPLLQEEAQKLDKKRIAMSEATPRLTAEATSQEGSQKGLAVPKGGNLVAQTNGFTKEKSAPSKKSRKSQKKDSKDKE